MPEPGRRDPHAENRLYQSVNRTGQKPRKPHGRTVSSYTAAATHARRNRVPLNRGLLALTAVLLALAALAVLVICLGGNRGSPNLPDTLATAPGQFPSTGGKPADLPQGLRFDTVTVRTETMHEGKLILVNDTYAYTFPDSTVIASVNRNKSDYFITWFEFSLESVTLQNFNRLIDDFYAATGCGRTLLNSAYRTLEDQQEIYATTAAGFATEPGHSEHHTGMALDIEIYDPTYGDKNVWYFKDYARAAWLVEHFDDYGFILRYPEDKINVTKIAYEAWHYRYISTPHAAVCDLLGDCLEEYIARLEKFAFSGTRLYYDGTAVTEGDYTAAPASGWMIYFVPAAAGETTDIPVPEGSSAYEISGDNVSGFIVTVRLGA